MSDIQKASQDKKALELQSEKAPDQNTSDTKLQGFLFHLDTKFLLVLLILGLFGILLIFIAIVIEKGGLDKHIAIPFIKEMGILLFAVVTTTLVHERFLKHHSLKEVRNVLSEQLQDVITKSLPDEITKVISKQLPPRYANIKESGIVDAYPDLKTDRLIEKIKDLDQGSEVFILKIWLTGIDTLESAIKTAIKKGCKFKIIILHPDTTEVFRKRGKFLKGTSINDEVMKDRVIDSIKRLKLLKEALGEDKHNLEIKLHKDFVSASIFGYDSDILVGLYLHNNIAESNIQLKIEGKNTRFYKAFKSHFDLQWESETNMNLEEYILQNQER